MKKLGIILSLIIVFLFWWIFAYRVHMSNKLENWLSLYTFPIIWIIWNTISSTLPWPQTVIEIPVVNMTWDNFKFKLAIFDENLENLKYSFLGESNNWDSNWIFTVIFKDSILWFKEYKLPVNAIQRVSNDIFEINFKDFGGYTNEDWDIFYTLFPRWEVDSVYLQIFHWNNSYLEFSILDDDKLIDDENLDNQNNKDINSIIETTLIEHEDCGDDWWENNRTFVNFAILWTGVNKTWNLEYYIVSNWEWFYIDERWNLSNSCWFGWIPTTIEFEKNFDGKYEVVRYEVAKDWSDYESSTKEMFSKEAFKKWEKWDFVYNTDVPFLEQAEKYFWITIIPETENKFECDFCDKIRYESDADDDYFKNNNINIWYNLSLQPTENKTFEFKSDWTFETKWSRDEWTWTWVFGKDEDTVVVLMNELQHVYNRYNILQKSETGLLMSLEIIQRR